MEVYSENGKLNRTYNHKPMDFAGDLEQTLWWRLNVHKSLPAPLSLQNLQGIHVPKHEDFNIKPGTVVLFARSILNVMYRLVI